MEQKDKMTFEEVIEKQGKLIYTNVGVSMLPWIHEGVDLIVIEPVPEVLKKYDVVLFRRPQITGRGRYVLHRIMRLYEDGTFYIIGDNTLSGERVKRENIIGILTAIRQPKRLIRVTDTDYRLKVWLWWHFAYPVRNFCRRAVGKCKRIVKRIWD